MTILIILLLLASIHIDNSLYRLIIRYLGGGYNPYMHWVFKPLSLLLIIIALTIFAP